MKLNDIQRWRVEIEIAEKWRDDNFGRYDESEHSKAGENIDYFERGISINRPSTGKDILTTLNIIHSVVKNIVPALYYQNPRILTFPKKAEDQDTAPIVSQILNYYYKELDMEEVNQKVIWDAYVLGHGYCKVGYTTKYGIDIRDENVKKTSVIDKALQVVGLKKKEEKEITHPEIDYRIISERPYVNYISPFNFGRDPRANSLEESMYWYQKFRRTVKYMKENKKYKNTAELEGAEPTDNKIAGKMAQAEFDDFKTVDVYEIHYRNDDIVYELVISKDGDVSREHYHEESIYQMDGWQVLELTFNKHGHKGFAISDITKIRNLQDRYTSTVDSILEQVDRFPPKIAYNEGDLTPEGKLALRDGDIGALIACVRNPKEVFQELGFNQVKADLRVLCDDILGIVATQVGVTKTQLTGVTQGETATEATIAQGGQTLRISDMNRAVHRFSRKQAQKLWQVIKQFVSLDELQLINGETGVDEMGKPIYNWLMVSLEDSEKMQIGDYDFDIEVGSTQKPDLAQVRGQFENLFSILARTDVVMLMQQQGDKLVISELLKMYLNLFPEAVKDIGRILQKITPQTTGLIPPQVEESRGGTTPGSNFNALEKQAAVTHQGVM